MSCFVIRSPRPAEVEALADLHLRTWQETYAGRFPPSAWGEAARRQRLRLWEAICSSPRADDRFAIAERDGELIGLAGAGRCRDDPAPRERELFFIYVLASEQGSGAGQALLDEVLGADAASLWVLEGNRRAVAFYARNGFEHDGARKSSGYEAGGDEIRLVRPGRPLSGRA